jgi:acyl-CoA dehydrogenase
MVDFALSPRERELFNKTMDFSRKYVIPYARDLEDAKDFPWDLVQKAFSAGLMNSHIPKKYGGPEHTMVEETLIGEALAYGDSGVATTILVRRSCAVALHTPCSC